MGCGAGFVNWTLGISLGMSERRRILAACGAILLVFPIYAADSAVPPKKDEVDQDMLEFLGSVGPRADSSAWFDFLRSTDIHNEAKRPAKPGVPPKVSQEHP